MKIQIFDLNKKKIGEKEMPVQFSEEIRPDLVHHAVITMQKNKRQPYGAMAEAGERHSAKLSRRRRDYKGSYGLGISRVPRKIMSRRGTRMVWVGAIAPGTRGGRQAHPPKANKVYTKKINKKERRKAIRSALSATLIRGIVEKRGHKVPVDYPFIIEGKLEEVDSANGLIKIIENFNLSEEVKRASIKKVRSGKGKLRARKYKHRVGPLFIVSNNCKLMKVGNSFPGITVVTVNNLNAELLAPGTNLGRLTIFTEEAINKLEKNRLFI